MHSDAAKMYYNKKHITITITTRPVAKGGLLHLIKTRLAAGSRNMKPEMVQKRNLS